MQIAKREFLSFVNTPVAYVVVVPLLTLMSFLYFREVMVVANASLRPFVELLPWFLIIVAPALTMRLFADEYKRDTIELLFAHPLGEWEIVLGKFLGAYLFYLSFLATTVGLPVVLIVFSSP
ncbi:MAG: ABC transporter, partial [Phototrophicales bacterium]